MDPARRNFELDQGQYQNDQKEDPGQRRSIAHLEVAKGIIEEVIGVEHRRIVGPPLGHNIGLGENLHGADDAHDQIEKDIGWFSDKQQSTENLVIYIWEQISMDIPLPAKLYKIRW